MKLLSLFLAVLIQSSAFAAEVSCRDTLTFAYGTAHAEDNAATGKTTITFSSSVISIFAQRFIPNPASIASVILEFNSSDCQGLSSCSASDVKMTLENDQNQPVEVFADTAVVTLSDKGLDAEVVKGVMIRADVHVPLNKCSSAPAHSARKAVDISGTDAQSMYKTLGLSPGRDQGEVAIVGYVTERAHPPINFTDLNLTIQGQSTQPTLTDNQRTDLANIIMDAGIEPGINAGGTTYVTIDVKFTCTASGAQYTCHIE